MKHSIASYAMLAALNISQWTARRYDKSVSTEIEKQHQAVNAGRFNKLLVDKSALEPIEKVAGAARQYHYHVTLPWGENGERLLSAKLFQDFSKAMNGYREEFEARVREFVASYPQLREASRKRLGTMYQPKDYPEDIQRRFEFAISFSPVPSADDFRVNLSESHVDSIKREIVRRTEERQAAALKDVWTRVREVVSKIQEQTGTEDRRIYDSSIENARSLIDILPALNLNQDPELDAIAVEMKTLLVPVDRLRQDKGLRANTAKAAEDILARLPWA